MVSVSGGAAKEILKGYIQRESRLTTLFEYISNEKDSKHSARVLHYLLTGNVFQSRY